VFVPASPANGSSSRPPHSGLRGSARPNAKATSKLNLKRLSLIPLLVVDEVGYIPFDPQAANLMFELVSSRYERASMIVTSNKPFSAWGEIDRLIHHADILSLKGDSYRLRGKDLAPRPAPPADLG
jgi:DNA replication protein DnaC